MSRSNIIVLAIVVLLVLGVAFYTLRGHEQAPIDSTPVEQAALPEAQEAVEPEAPEASEAEEQATFVPEPQEEEAEAEELVLPEDATLDQKFEFVLNTMLRDVSAKASDYRVKRKVLKELSLADNLKTKEAVEENFLLAQELVPQLYKEAADISQVFQDADAEITALAAEKPEEARAGILEKWDALKRENAGAYSDFFAVEDEVIKAHERLMRFYFVKRDFYSIDSETSAVTFESENDQRLERQLRLRINRLKRTQDQALSSQ